MSGTWQNSSDAKRKKSVDNVMETLEIKQTRKK